MINPDPERQIMTTAEVAALFQVGAKTILRWADQGRLGSVRTPGRSRRFDQEEVEALLGQADPQDELMAAREVAALFRVEVHTIARWARTGVLRAETTPGGRYRYTRAAVMELLHRGMTPEESPVSTYRKLPYDPDNAELTEEEQRLDEIQSRGLKERQADQERAGHRFDLFDESDWGT